MVSSARRVLVVAYHYPPEPASGAQRMGYLARYVSEYGWEPTVLTRRAPANIHPESNVVRVGRQYRAQIAPQRAHPGKTNPLLEAVKARAREILFFPDRAVGWIPHAIAAGIAEHRRRPFDAIVSSAMPASTHLVASALSALCRIPWIADYRDLWNENPYVHEPRWRASLLLRLERSALRRASAITTITAALAAALERIHRRPARAIPNVVDAAEWDGVPFPPQGPDGFRIVHAGSLYDGLRSPAPLFEAVAQLRAAGELDGAHLDFYGPDPGNLLELASASGIRDIVTYHGVVERGVAMRAERAAALLVIIQNSDPRTASEYGSKVFEYQAAGPSILAVGPPESVLRDYIDQHQLGWFASSSKEISEALRAAYARSAQGCSVRSNLQRETARGLAQAFAASLDAVVDVQVPERLKESAILR